MSAARHVRRATAVHVAAAGKVAALDSIIVVPRAPAARRRPWRSVEDEVLATAHALGVALHRVGALDAAALRGLDALCLPSRPD